MEVTALTKTEKKEKDTQQGRVEREGIESAKERGRLLGGAVIILGEKKIHSFSLFF